jgi:hypothetical protein
MRSNCLGCRRHLGLSGVSIVNWYENWIPRRR